MVWIYDEYQLQNHDTQTSEHPVDTGSKGACMHMSRINHFFTVQSYRQRFVEIVCITSGLSSRTVSNVDI